MTKIDLIYIASTGRSGSTLLESILGAHLDIVTTGEVHIWPHEIVSNSNIPCSCGVSVPKCPFWLALQKNVNPLLQPSPQIHFFREEHNAGRTLRWKHLLEFWQTKASSKLQEQINTYSQNSYSVFKAFLELSREKCGKEAKWIVDSSKDPYRLLWLVKSGLFNIKILHVTKDPRAFVYSMSKNLLPDVGLSTKIKITKRTVDKSFAWLAQNILTSVVHQNFMGEDCYLSIQYEKLAAKPYETLTEIGHLIGCDFSEDLIKNFWEAEMHTIAGNSMRSMRGEIKLDEQWKTALPPKYKKLTEFITRKGMYQFGYSCVDSLRLMP